MGDVIPPFGGVGPRLDGPAAAAYVDSNGARYRSFLLWCNAQSSPCEIRLPENDWVDRGEVVLSTDPRHPHGAEVKAGEQLTLSPRSLLLLREV